MSRRWNTQFTEIFVLIPEDPEEERPPSPFFDEQQEILDNHSCIHQPIRRLPTFGEVESQITLVVERVAIDVFLSIAEDEYHVRSTNDARRALFEPSPCSRATPEGREVIAGQNDEVYSLRKSS